MGRTAVCTNTLCLCSFFFFNEVGKFTDSQFSLKEKVTMKIGCYLRRQPKFQLYPGFRITTQWFCIKEIYQQTSRLMLKGLFFLRGYHLFQTYISGLASFIYTRLADYIMIFKSTGHFKKTVQQSLIFLCWKRKISTRCVTRSFSIFGAVHSHQWLLLGFLRWKNK